MNAVVSALPETQHFLSGNEAVARAAWEAGVHVAAAYPGTPSTEILENIAYYHDIYSEWSVNEKVSLEVAIGASITGARALCAMKHVGMNVASDAFMTQSLAGIVGGLVIIVADDVGLSSSQNEQDSRYWGRFGHMPVLEPADAQETHTMLKEAFEISEAFEVPVILRMTTRVCHVKGLVDVGERQEHSIAGFDRGNNRWIMTPTGAKQRLPVMQARDQQLKVFTESHALNQVYSGSDTRLGFVTSGPGFLHVKEAFPDAPILKLGLSHPAPIEKIRQFAQSVEKLVVVEETEQLLETELRAAGIDNLYGKDYLPFNGEQEARILTRALAPLTGESVEEEANQGSDLFPRPPTMCTACPHLGPYYALSRIRNIHIVGDIGCYTLGAGHPWQALDTCISMGASMGMALGMEKALGPDSKKKVVAVIGDSTFLHMGIQGLLDMVYNGGNITVMLLDNRSVGMTGGQENPGTGRNLAGDEAPRVDFVQLVKSLGVREERIRMVDPYEMPTVYKTVREETKQPEPSVIITNRPCVLTDYYDQQKPFKVIDEDCNGCGKCLDVGCPVITVTRRETVIKPNGSEKELAFTTIDSSACTGCRLCVDTCAPDAIVPAIQEKPLRFVP